MFSYVTGHHTEYLHLGVLLEKTKQSEDIILSFSVSQPQNTETQNHL